MAPTYRQLAQARPGSTDAVALYRPATGYFARVDAIYVANTDSSSRTFRIFSDADGHEYDQSNAIAYDVTIQANHSMRFDGPFYVNGTDATLGVRSSAASALTFTAWGVEYSSA